MINADAITGAKIADDAIDSEHYVDGSIDTAHIGDLQVTTAKIAADAITGAKIADDAIDSEHYTDGSIDTAHLGDLQVTTAKIAADAITAAKIADAAISEEHLDPSVINSLPDASIASADFLMFFDATDSALKKVDAAELGVGTALTEIVGDTSPQLGGTLDANGNAIDMNGLADGLILDTDADTTISAPTDDQIDIEIAGADDFTFTANTFTALTGSDIVHADTGSVRNRPNSQPIMINGDMQIAQRATTVTGVTTSTMATCDRVNFFISSAGTWTIKQTADAPTGSGFAKCYELDCTTADGSLSASDQARIELKFEGQDCQVFKKGTSSAEKMTVCFWVKSHKTGTHVLQVYDADNNRSVSQQYTISSADTWEKKTVNIPADTTGAFTNDNAESLNLSWWICAGTDFTSGTINTTWESRTLTKIADGQVNGADSTDNNFRITGIQIEVGEFTSSTIPSFQHESFGDSLARCQRYYYTSTIQTEDMLGVGWTFSATSVLRWNLQLPVFMRSAPTVSFQGDDVRLWNGANGTNAAVSVNYSDQNHLECDCSCDSGLTATVGIVAMIYLKTNGEVVATAEL
jgi:hypothetical protein